ncbi:type II secretion system protein GspL [Sandarakinorhabdus sp. DWP1-3-1]|uniref:type II secretion system protein GspL n=1 Tax=Sandarakinorhabdus sp. DWP1-3-1 TaxID=2804627 RepID=UPI003CE8AE7C
MIRWLAFLDGDGSHWLRLDDDVATARGPGLPAVADGDALIAVVPGTAVVLHWVELPPLAPAQALAAARLLAADVSGAPVADVHVAIGAPDAEGFRPMALVDRGAMAVWLAQLAAAGLDPDRIVPLPMLLPVPAGADDVTVLAASGHDHVRGQRLAFSAEPGLTPLLIGDRNAERIDLARFDAGLDASLADLPIDLRQGEFARVQAWRVEQGQTRRIALTLAAALALWLVGDAAVLFRTSLAADRAEQQLADAARTVLPRGTAIDAPRAQVAARLASLGGAGQGLTGLAAALLGALQGRPAATLQSLGYTPDTGLTALVAVPGADDGQAIAAGLAAAGVEARIGSPRPDNGVTVVDVMVRPR